MDLTQYVRHSTSGIVRHSEYHGALPAATSMVVGAGASELTGYLIGRYHEMLQKTSVPVPLVAGAALQIGSIVLDAIGGGGHGLAARLGIASLRALGDAGTNTFFALDGVARGYAKSGAPLSIGTGKESRALPQGWTGADRLWGQPQGAQTSVGHIPQAGPGDWLDDGGLRHFVKQASS